MSGFDQFEKQLLASVAARGGHAPAAQSGRWRRRSGLIALVTAAAIVTPATAAVWLSRSTAPFAGDVRSADPAQPIGLLGDSHYRVSLVPDLRAGHAGWCGTVVLAEDGASTGSEGCSPAPDTDGHQIVAGAVGQQATDGSGADFLYAAVFTDQVAAVSDEQGRQVSTAGDSSLPNGWRYVVLHTHDPAYEPELFDADGRTLPEPQRANRTVPTEPWDTAKQPADKCPVTLDAGLATSGARRATDPAPADLIRGTLFSCASAQVQGPSGSTYEFAYLIAASGEDLPELPSTRPDGQGLYIGDDLTARRDGDSGWLVAVGKDKQTRANIIRDFSN